MISLKFQTQVRTAELLTDLAVKAMIKEVDISPKPGLVDSLNNGAHKDMDRNLFHLSAHSIKPFFLKMVQSTPVSELYSTILPLLRPIGIEAEESMMTATGGINTHRGQIFSLGVCLAATKRIISVNGSSPCPGSDILLEAGRICQGISGELETPEKKREISHGENVYRTHNCKGIRGEAESGFPTVRLIALPLLKELTELGLEEEPASLEVLIKLYECTNDTTVLHRRGSKGLNILKTQAQTYLKRGGVRQDRSYDMLKEMNLKFVKENISPGGCADLLALTFFIWSIEQKLKTGEICRTGL